LEIKDETDYVSIALNLESCAKSALWHSWAAVGAECMAQFDFAVTT
jgi:hypothetical protein